MGDHRSRDVLDPVLRDIADARHYNDWLFSRARPYLGRTVLDVGAGLGTFTERAAAAGATVTALEPEFGPLLRERLRDLPGLTVLEVPVEALEGGGTFDSILCFNVLEHVEDDAWALRAFRDQLRPGGWLLLLVPAHEVLYGGYDRAAGHVRRYDRAPLLSLLQRTGFEVEELRHVNPVGALGWLARVRLRRGDEWPTTSFRMFDRLVPVLRHLDRLRLPFGLSLWAVARRPSAERARARSGTGSRRASGGRPRSTSRPG
jgi:SAM-dependent methyltransferase